MHFYYLVLWRDPLEENSYILAQFLLNSSFHQIPNLLLVVKFWNSTIMELGYYTSDPSLYSPYKAEYARFLVQEEVRKEISALKPQIRDKILDTVSSPSISSTEAAAAATIQPDASKSENGDKPTSSETPKVAIVGAWIAGLYTALILEYLKIDFEILESSDRVGGRIRTHYFPTDPPKNPPKNPPKDDKDNKYLLHQYYDIGAMRFPKVPTMDRYV